VEAFLELDLETLRGLAQLLTENDITEFEHEADGVRVKLVRGPRATTTYVTQAGAPAPVAQVTPSGAPAPASPSMEPPADAIDITSPFVGTFYRAPSPDAPPFVDVGTVVRPGQTLCIVEAMKLMNEIEAECSGTITEVFAQNGKPVEFGQKLFRVKKA
jgi:acetyl-CoA carboxylase biotin carboxyl carrier protein